MAITLSSGIYPPLVKDAMPTFIRNQTCRVYFSLSDFNSIEQIKYVQLSLIRSRTNATALRQQAGNEKVQYPSELKMYAYGGTWQNKENVPTVNPFPPSADDPSSGNQPIPGSKLTEQLDQTNNYFYKDTTIQTQFCYFIRIRCSDLDARLASTDENRTFGINEYYQVQIRFATTEAADIPKWRNQQLDSWNNVNKQFLSEWSKVCLIRGIVRPDIRLEMPSFQGETTFPENVTQSELTNLLEEGLWGNYFYPWAPMYNTSRPELGYFPTNLVMYQREADPQANPPISEIPPGLYECLTSIPETEAWDAAKWAKIKQPLPKDNDDRKINQIDSAFVKLYGTLSYINDFYYDTTNPASGYYAKKAYFDDTSWGEGETEYLYKYTVTLYERKPEDVENQVWTSGEVEVDNLKEKNTFNLDIPWNFITDGSQTYRMTVDYTTNNFYNRLLTYDFNINYSLDNLDLLINSYADSLNGCNVLEIKLPQGQSATGTKKILIRRASSKTNFNLWENFKTVDIDLTQLPFIIKDFTIESGIFYKYNIQQVDDDGVAVSQANDSGDPIINVFEDTFLLSNNKQLRLEFNTQISNFKINVADSMQTTLGGKYPYSKRNGHNYYRTFSISGLISSLSDDSFWYINNPNVESDSSSGNDAAVWPTAGNIDPRFESREHLYGVSTSAYKTYNNANHISPYSDIIYEREFRQAVYEFLYDNKLKLFRSTTEGNILVKLSDISFSPLNELGRTLYSFTATATEMDEANLNNYRKYKVIS